MFLGTFFRSMYILSQRDYRLSHIYDSQSSVPSFEKLIDEGCWSWGEGFDRYDYVYYAIEPFNQIVFQWKIYRDPSVQNIGDETEPVKMAVSYQVFDQVVGHLLLHDMSVVH